MHPLVRPTPPPVPVTLAEAREWVGLTTPADDARLTALLAAATEMAEAYLGQALILRPVAERLPGGTGWRTLALRPVRAITGAAIVEEAAGGLGGGAAGGLGGGAPRALAPDEWAADIRADGSGRVRVSSGAPTDIAYTAGLAPDAAALPDAVRHGILRLATDLYRERDGLSALPPSAAVTALWRPFRQLSLGHALERCA